MNENCMRRVGIASVPWKIENGIFIIPTLLSANSRRRHHVVPETMEYCEHPHHGRLILRRGKKFKNSTEKMIKVWLGKSSFSRNEQLWQHN